MIINSFALSVFTNGKVHCKGSLYMFCNCPLIRFLKPSDYSHWFKVCNM